MSQERARLHFGRGSRLWLLLAAVAVVVGALVWLDIDAKTCRRRAELASVMARLDAARDESALWLAALVARIGLLDLARSSERGEPVPASDAEVASFLAEFVRREKHAHGAEVADAPESSFEVDRVEIRVQRRPGPPAAASLWDDGWLILVSMTGQDGVERHVLTGTEFRREWFREGRVDAAEAFAISPTLDASRMLQAGWRRSTGAVDTILELRRELMTLPR